MNEKIKPNNVIDFVKARNKAQDKEDGAEPGTNALADRLERGEEPHHTTEWMDDEKEKDENNKNKSKKD